MNASVRNVGVVAIAMPLLPARDSGLTDKDRARPTAGLVWSGVSLRQLQPLVLPQLRHL